MGDKETLFGLCLSGFLCLDFSVCYCPMAGPPPPARCKRAAQLRVESLGLDSGGFVKLLAPGGHRTHKALLHALDARGGNLRHGLREGAELALLQRRTRATATETATTTMDDIWYGSICGSRYIHFGSPPPSPPPPTRPLIVVPAVSVV